MLNEDNKTTLIKDEMNPMKTTKLSNKGAFACRRPVGEGYYDSHTDRTYVCWNEKGMDIYMAYYAHKDKVWSCPELVYKNELFGRWDYHDYVTMIKGKDGYPLFYYNIHSQFMYQLKRNTEGIFERRIISQDLNAYPSPIRYKDSIYIFYSKNEEISYPYRPMRYIKSIDEGEHWSEPKTVITSEKKMERKVDEVYQCGCEFAPACGEFPDRILLTWTMWGGLKGHASEGCGAYMVQFYLEEECFYNAEGKKLGEIINYDLMRTYCLIEEYYSPQVQYSNYGPLATTDEKGNPVVFYGINQEGKCYLKEARYKDEQWDINIIEQDICNIKDIRRGNGYIELGVCHGDKIIIYRRMDREKSFKKHSITKILHHNNSNSVPYLNYIDQAKDDVQIIYGLIEVENIESYYEGLWPVLVLGE